MSKEQDNKAIVARWFESFTPELIEAVSSTLEHQVPEQIFSTASMPRAAVSAVKAIQLALAQGARVHGSRDRVGRLEDRRWDSTRVGMEPGK